MANETDLWDDSAIVNAFNHAVTKYKAMHKQEHHNNSTVGKKAISSNPDNLPTPIDGDHEETRSVNLPTFQEKHQADSSSSEPFMHASSSHMPEAIEGYKSQQGEVGYTKLLNHYYELEGQMQKVLQQLQQAGYYGNYQYPSEGSVSCAQWGTCSSTQEQQDPNASHPPAVSSCCPYACPCLGDSCPLMPACALGGDCVSKMDPYSAATSCIGGPGKVSSLKDDSAIKTAMKAAERAISSVKVNTSSTTDVHEGKAVEESSDSSESKMAQNISSGTDLDIVLSAWYAAGFHTGRYLLEQQSNTKKGQHD